MLKFYTFTNVKLTWWLVDLKKIDKLTLTLFVSDDKMAFELVYKSYSASIFKRLLYLLKDEDEAEEMLQNVFIRVWTNRSSIDVEKNFHNYLLRIADSMAIDLIRRNVRNQLVYDSILIQGVHQHDSVEDTYLQKEEWAILENAIDQLPPQRKLIFTLCKLEGKSYGEVSKLLNISPATISNHLVLAMKQIRIFTSRYEKGLKMVLLLFF
ncbi:hypothetical protein GCM10011418_19150 [Sphingobacterium alkalisoli]|nr:sigma-70 family RNA polymerase sigma factor [Sphingobacterium alkalisoli]GGH16649.1 hypothetical protein GCM10011418_19150 [Sphingobacterium alkalisoli]